jgi:hypothetical protein
VEFDALHYARGGGLPNEIALGRSKRNHARRAGRNDVCHQVLELPSLVSATGKACQVIAFDPEIDSQVIRDCLKPMQRRGRTDEIYATAEHLRIMARWQAPQSAKPDVSGDQNSIIVIEYRLNRAEKERLTPAPKTGAEYPTCVV